MVRKSRGKIFSAALFALLCLVNASTHAGGIIIGGTRIIYLSNKKEASIDIKNNSNSNPFLIQSWVDIGDEKTRGPFVVTPPLFRIDPTEEHLLRITKMTDSLPKDRESLFYFNIRSIPNSEREATNTLKLVVKTRIKMFYRPSSLPGYPEDACKELVFKKINQQLEVSNPSAYYVVFENVKIGNTPIKEADMVAPFSKVLLPLPVNEKSDVLTWRVINDYGGTTKNETRKI